MSWQGNLILADSNYEVLTLLRSHRDDAKGFAIMARHPYPIHTIRLRQSITQEQLDSALESADEKQTLRGDHCKRMTCLAFTPTLSPPGCSNLFSDGIQDLLMFNWQAAANQSVVGILFIAQRSMKLVCQH